MACHLCSWDVGLTSLYETEWAKNPDILDWNVVH
jgi:hypothetical protein